MATAAPDRLTGRMLDADAHLYLEPEVMQGLLEPIGRDWVIEMLEDYKRSDHFPADKAKGVDDIWGVKGLAAHGVCEPDVRVATMDRMGLARQLAFPNTLGRESNTPHARGPRRSPLPTTTTASRTKRTARRSTACARSTCSRTSTPWPKPAASSPPVEGDRARRRLATRRHLSGQPDLGRAAGHSCPRPAYRSRCTSAAAASSPAGPTIRS